MIERAAANNAAWCDFVCRRAGLEPAFADDAWTCPQRTPDLYPDAVTLRADVDVASVLARIDTGPGCSVKDSFAVLDLESRGFEVLFEAEWIERLPLAGGWSPPDWDVRHLPGADLCRTGATIGLANVSGDWTELARLHPAGTLVGYERGPALAAALAAGFAAIGPLRVWVHPD